MRGSWEWPSSQTCLSFLGELVKELAVQRDEPNRDIVVLRVSSVGVDANVLDG